MAMDNTSKDEMEAILHTILTMISKSEKAKGKFAQGTSQYTLQKNRLNALNIVLSLIREELTESVDTTNYTKEDLSSAAAPLASLISKSEKARTKLKPGSWQYTMLSDNLKALHIASLLLEKALKNYDFT